MSELLGIPVGSLTLNGIALVAIALTVFGLIRGWLVPSSTVKRELQRADQRADDYKELWQVADQRADTLQLIAGDVVVIGETMNKVLKSLPGPYQEGSATEKVTQ